MAGPLPSSMATANPRKTRRGVPAQRQGAKCSGTRERRTGDARRRGSARLARSPIAHEGPARKIGAIPAAGPRPRRPHHLAPTKLHRSVTNRPSPPRTSDSVHGCRRFHPPPTHHTTATLSPAAVIFVYPRVTIASVGTTRRGPPRRQTPCPPWHRAKGTKGHGPVG